MFAHSHTASEKRLALLSNWQCQRSPMPWYLPENVLIISVGCMLLILQTSYGFLSVPTTSYGFSGFPIGLLDLHATKPWDPRETMGCLSQGKPFARANGVSCFDAKFFQGLRQFLSLGQTECCECTPGLVFPQSRAQQFRSFSMITQACRENTYNNAVTAMVETSNSADGKNQNRNKRRKVRWWIRNVIPDKN